MGKAYGIEICKNALVFLSSEEIIRARLNNAFAEMMVMKLDAGVNGDLSEEQNQTLTYLHLKSKEVDQYDIKRMAEIATNLVALCLDIIDVNTRQLEKQN